MLTVMFVIHCDVCGEMYDRLRSCCEPDPTLWSLTAGDLQDTCGTEDFWFFNPKTRKHWCLDCRSEWDETAVPLAQRAAADHNEDFDCEF